MAPVLEPGANPTGDQDYNAGPQLWHGPTLTVIDTCKVNHWMGIEKNTTILGRRGRDVFFKSPLDYL